MSIWKDQNPPKRDTATGVTEAPAPRAEPVAPIAPAVAAPVAHDPPRAPADRDAKESVIATDLTIEGKIEGTGHLRVAGKFKGDVNVQGHITIEPGAKVSGGVRAGTVVISGELEGNIDAASRVELLQTGVLIGDLKAGSLTVAAGSRMRGQVEFGWEGKPVSSSGTRGGAAS